jgi:hypothetical protein
MKNKLWLVLGLLLMVSSGYGQVVTQFTSSDDLDKVEELKPDELASMAQARVALLNAQNALISLEYQIASKHNMSNESWSYTEIHGKYILHFFRSYLGGMISTYGSILPASPNISVIK